MSEDNGQNGRVQPTLGVDAPPPVSIYAFLQEKLKDPKLRLLRVEANDAQYLQLEEAIQNGIQTKAQAHLLVSQAPVFEWWSLNGVWPRYPEGWTLLLRRARVAVQAQPGPQAPPPKILP